MNNLTTDRRSFLKSGAILGGGLLISFVIPPKLRGLLASDTESAAVLVPNAFLKVNADNTINIFLAHSEMGQGIWTSLSMLIADELDANLKDIRVEHAPAAPEYKHTIVDFQITGASTTTYSEFDRYRYAGATARWLLVAAAAKKMGVGFSDCRTENGFVIAGGKRIPYGELVGPAAKLTPPAKIALKKPEEWKYIGHNIRRLDGLPKVNGTAVFGIDVKGDDLLIATVVHSQVIGSKIDSYDDSEAKKVPGIVAVLQVPTGIAVLARDYYTANKAKKLLKINWSKSDYETFSSQDLTESSKLLVEADGMPAVKKGNVDLAGFKAWKTVESTYTFPYLTHVPMEPLNATVKISSDKKSCEIWTGTQLPGNEQAVAAKILGISPGQVKIHTTFLGGGFGRRVNPQSDWVTEAVEIAKASGRFIKMIWAREDDIKGQYYRPQYVHKVKVALNEKGLPEVWHHNLAGQAIYQEHGWVFNVKNGIDQSSVEGMADSQYLDAIPNVFMGVHTTKSPVSVLWLRSVGHTHTAFVMETMIDQLAQVAGKDAVEYRRLLLSESPRSLAVLNLAAEKSGWGKPLPEGHYQGVAVQASFKSYVAQVVEVSLDQANNIIVHKVTCAIDCGLNVNPENIKSQMESGIVFGLSMAKYGEVTITRGRVDQNNFYDYKIVRMNETPVMDVYLVPYTGQEMGGVGETAVPPLAPALANALFKATGRRFHSLPLMNQFINTTKS